MVSLLLAAAGVIVDDFLAEIDIAEPSFDWLASWLPKLNVGGDSAGTTKALEVRHPF